MSPANDNTLPRPTRAQTLAWEALITARSGMEKHHARYALEQVTCCRPLGMDAARYVEAMLPGTADGAVALFGGVA